LEGSRLSVVLQQRRIQTKAGCGGQASRRRNQPMLPRQEASSSQPSMADGPSAASSKRGPGESSRPRGLARRWSSRGSGVSSRPQFPVVAQSKELERSGGGWDEDESPDSVTFSNLRLAAGHGKPASTAIDFIISNCKGGVGHKGGIGDFYEALASLRAAERFPNGTITQMVNSTGAAGIDLHVLKARIETVLQLQRSVKTLRLSKYLRAYPNFFRVETHADGLNHVYPVTAPHVGGVVEAPELPLLTPGGGDTDVAGAYRERLRLDGCGAGVLPLMSPADLVERHGVPPHMAEQLVKEARTSDAVLAPTAFAAAAVFAPTTPAHEAPYLTSGLSHDAHCATKSNLAAIERAVGFTPIRVCGGSATDRGSSSSGASSSPDDELQRLRASEAALQAQAGELTHRCSDLQLRVNDLEEARLCTICFEHPRDTVVLPCMHAHFCGGCLRGAGLAAAATTCPTCRGVIAGTLALRLGLVD
jgi:hypothetical protein